MNDPKSLPCCSATTWARQTGATWARRTGAVAVLLTVATLAYLVGRNRTLTAALQSSAHPLAGSPTITVDGQTLPIVDAAGAVVSEKFSIATGPVSEDSEGFFMLDHNSGLLQCQTIYPRLGQVGAKFVANVAEGLGNGGQGGSYLMLTGRVNFPRSSNQPAASVVVYVMDTATGQFVAYGVPFNESMVNSGRPQNGALVLVTRGSANPLIDRDSLR